MLSDSPWRDLKEDGVDSRRVDHTGRWNFFWAVMPGRNPALALVLEARPIPEPKLPKLRSLETGFAFLSGGQTFYLRLKDHAQLELFENLCRDVVRCTALATREAEALTRAIVRMCRWHHLLRGGRGDGLSEEEQKGLIGELAVLELLSDLIGPRAAITAWTGPMGSPKDFEFQGHCIEVKARRAAAQPYVRISNEFQLADVEDHRLWLSVLAVDKVTRAIWEQSGCHRRTHGFAVSRRSRHRAALGNCHLRIRLSPGGRLLRSPVGCRRSGLS